MMYCFLLSINVMNFHRLYDSRPTPVVRRSSQSFNTQYEYAVYVRSTQAALTTAHSSIRNTGAEYAGRPQAALGRARQDAIRSTQYAEHPQAALSTARQDAIRSTQYADTPPALAYLLLSPTINGLLIRSSLGGVLPGRYAERSRPTNT